MKNKILILEASGFDSIRYSIDKEVIRREDLNEFFQQQNIEIHSAREAYEGGELNYSENPNLDMLLEYQSFSNLGNKTSDFEKEKYKISEKGTVAQTKDKRKKLSVYIDCSTKDKKTFEDWTSPKISDKDKSYILLAQRFIKEIESTDSVAILAHDQKLRIHANRRDILTFGSSSLLASMVLIGIYNYQKGTCVYNFWRNRKTSWVPKDVTFKKILDIERTRIKNNRSFFIN